MLLVTGSIAGSLAGATSPAGLQDAFAGSGVLGAVAFAGLYAVLTVMLFPGSALTIAAGAIFGPIVGTLVSLAGALLGATAAFAIARHTARAPLEQVQSERVARIQERLRQHGLLSIVALRLVPLVPFNALNYVAGASAIRTLDYVAGTAIGIIPGAIAFATLGGSIDDPVPRRSSPLPRSSSRSRSRVRSRLDGVRRPRSGSSRSPRSCAGSHGPRRSC